MSSNSEDTNENERKKPKLGRITVSLDDFEYEVVKQMSNNRSTPRSEIMRDIVHHWIQINHELLNKYYSVNVTEISTNIKMDKESEYIQTKLEKLVRYFQNNENIQIDRLATYLELSSNMLIDLIENNRNQLEKKGLILYSKDEKIYKKGND